MTREQLKDYGIKVTQANGTELVKLTLELAAEYVGEAEKSVDDKDLFTVRINKARAFYSTSDIIFKYAVRDKQPVT